MAKRKNKRESKNTPQDCAPETQERQEPAHADPSKTHAEDIQAKIAAFSPVSARVLEEAPTELVNQVARTEALYHLRVTDALIEMIRSDDHLEDCGGLFAEPEGCYGDLATRARLELLEARKALAMIEL